MVETKSPASAGLFTFVPMTYSCRECRRGGLGLRRHTVLLRLGGKDRCDAKVAATLHAGEVLFVGVEEQVALAAQTSLEHHLSGGRVNHFLLSFRGYRPSCLY